MACLRSNKDNHPLRPIVACSGSITYASAKFIADIISPLVGQSEHHIKNSKDLVTKLEDFTLSEDEELVSYDVTALFTCTPVNETINIIEERLHNDVTLPERTDLSVDQIVELLRFLLTTTYFQYDGEFYNQLEGAAMGSPVSPLTANIFMEDFECKTLSSYPNPPRFWGRYVDDTMVIIQRCEIENFTNHINSLHPAIKFTIEREVNGQLPMLDVRVIRETDGTLSFQVYRKPTHTNQYLNFASHHPLQHKLGVIRTLVDRASSIVTKKEEHVKELSNIYRSLAVCGYSKWTMDIANNRNKETRRLRRNNVTTHQVKGSVTIPYLAGVSESLRRLLISYGITTHVKPQNTIRSMLVAPKDKTDKLDKAGAIYGLSCLDCPSSYVGKTARTLRTRLSEHERPTSPVAEHTIREQHHIDWDGVRILDREEDWFRRGVREAIHIRRLGSDLNRDRGRHDLPVVYNKLLALDQNQSISVGQSGQVAIQAE